MDNMKNLGGVIISKNIIEKNGLLKWCIREEPMNINDNGWRFFSDIDTEEYLADTQNLAVYNWESVFEIEPAIGLIFDMSIGTELTLIYDGEKKFFVDSNTGKRI